MSGVVVFDTCEVFLRRKSDKHAIATAVAQLASIEQTLGINEGIYAGIGNKEIFRMKGQKEVTFTLRNALYDAELLAATQGVEVTDGTVKYFKTEKDLTVVDNSGTLEVTIAGDPIETKVYVSNAAGVLKEADVTGNIVAIPTGHASVGEKVSVIYLTETLVKNKVELDSEKFAEAFEVTCRTVAYDTIKKKVVSEIYIQLDNAVPLDEFTLSFENGNPIAPEITMNCTPESLNSTKIGRIFEVEVTP